jgi:endonuclease/exonuclease/phosphatase family metal-dependent hydrolase
MVSAAEANVVLGGDFNWYDQDKSLDPFDKVSKGPEHGDYRVEGLNLKFKDAHYEYSLGKAGSKAELTKDRQNFKSCKKFGWFSTQKNHDSRIDRVMVHSKDGKVKDQLVTNVERQFSEYSDHNILKMTIVG